MNSFIQVFLLILTILLTFKVGYDYVENKKREKNAQKNNLGEDLDDDESKLTMPVWILMSFVILFGLLFLTLKPLIDVGFIPKEGFFSSGLGQLISLLSLNLGQALVVGGLVGVLFEIGSVRRYFEKRISNILINDTYLKNQENEELMRLRKRATKNIFAKKQLIVDPNLVKLDNQICETFIEPYFDYFQETSNCELDAEKKFITKTVRTRFKIINPKIVHTDFLLFYKPRVRFKSIEGVEDNDIRKIDTLEIKVDKGEFIKFTDSVEVVNKVENQINGDDSYNITTEMSFKDNVKKNTLTFQNAIEVRIIETRKIPINDLNYSFRMDHLVKNFKTTLVFEGEDVELIGNIYGTMTNPRRGLFIDKDSNSISLESKEWMLKGNGAYINIIPKKLTF